MVAYNRHLRSILLLLLLLASGCSSLFFYPQRGIIEDPLVQQFSPHDVFFKTPDGLTLHGWFLRAPGEAQGTVLVLHGNAQNVSAHVHGVLWLVLQGFNVFIFDYRGYGRSEGTPTLAGIHVDAEAALETLLTLPGVDSNRVAVLGQSLGGAVAVYLVANSPCKRHVRALVIDSAFSSYRRIAREKLGGFFLTWPLQYPLSLLFNDDYSPTKWIGKVSPVPLLIIQGEQDRVVPVHHAEVLFDDAKAPKQLWLSPPSGHIQSFANDAIRDDLVEYLERMFAHERLLRKKFRTVMKSSFLP